MAITGEVRTNLDNYRREVWPDVFVEVPRIGACIKSGSGKILKVVRITHCIKIDENEIDNPYPCPYVEIEVNK